MGRAEGKIAIVTGATWVDQGGLNIGGATASALAAEGAKVVLADINVTAAQALADRLNAEHGDKTAIAVATDIRVEAQIEALVKETVETFGGLNVLVNNSGVFLFLASDESSGINGEVVRVDGGLLGHQPFVPDMNRLMMTTV